MTWRLIDASGRERKMLTPAYLDFKTEEILHEGGGIMLWKLYRESMPKSGHMNTLSIKLCLGFFILSFNRVPCDFTYMIKSYLYTFSFSV